MKRERLAHPFQPLFDETSEILILGSFPSLLSRENAFYYGNPHNRFWPLLSKVYGEPLPKNDAERTELILRHHLALCDVIKNCTVAGSSDASIRDVVPLDIATIKAPLRLVILNGSTAGRLYEKFLKEQAKLPYAILPSTSPANASMSLGKLAKSYAPYLLAGGRPISL